MPVLSREHSVDPDVVFLFSADYELHLGENFASEREVLIEPTAQLLQVFSEMRVPMTLFADVASVWRYRELTPHADYPDAFEEQLRGAIVSGHDAQLHLHPHWLTSTFDGHRWHPDTSRYKLADFGFGEATAPNLPTAEQIVARGCSYLRNLLRPVDRSYDCIAFRAGGYGIQPGERQLFRALISAGIRIDSSVVPGLTYTSNVNSIDFARVPGGINYFVNADSGLGAPALTGLFEIPIPAYKEGFGETIRRRVASLPWLAFHEVEKRARRLRASSARGRGIQSTTLSRRVLSRLLSRGMFALELSGPALDVDRLVDGTVRFIGSRSKHSNTVYVSPSCHPKEVFGKTLDDMKAYWSKIVKRFPSARAITFRQAARELDNADQTPA